MQSLESRSAVATLDFSQVKSIRLRDRIKDAVKAVKVSGFDANGKKTIQAEKQGKSRRPRKKQVKATNADTLKIVTRGESQEQINALADAALSQQSDDQQAGDLTMIGNPKLVAGNTIMLTNMGMFSGKYLIKSARHSYSKNQGYITNLEVRMLEFIADGLASTTQSTKEEETASQDNTRDLSLVDDRLLQHYPEDLAVAQQQRKEKGMI